MIDDGDTLHTTLDKAKRLSREASSRRSGVPPRAPGLWNAHVVYQAPTPVYGAYPVGFIDWARSLLGATRPEILHVCSGSLGPEVGGVRVDLRADARPTVRADGRRLPFRDGCFAAAMIDPPYSVEFARELYDTEYPRPLHLLSEAARVVQRGGAIGFLHFLIPFPPPGLRFERCFGVTMGLGRRIRALTIFRREEPSLDFRAGQCAPATTFSD